MSKKKRLFKLTKKDFTIQTFRSGGPGGQHQNKRDTGVRITHSASGAVGESRSEKSQRQNRNLVTTWVRITAAMLEGRPSVKERVDEMVQPKNLRIEAKDSHGRWVESPRL